MRERERERESHHKVESDLIPPPPPPPVDQVMLRGAGEEGEEGEGGTEKQLIRKCYSSITLSTNSKSVDK